MDGIESRTSRIAERIAGRAREASHYVYLQEYPESASRDDIRKDIDRNMDNVYDPGETPSGMKSNLIVFDKVFGTREEAERFLAGYAGRYQDCACKYRKPDIFKDYGLLEPQYRKIKKAVWDYVEDWFGKTDAVCPKCGFKAGDVPRFLRSCVDDWYDTSKDEFILRPKELWCPECTGTAIHDFARDPGLEKLMEKKKELDDLWRGMKERSGSTVVWLARADRHV